MEGPAAPNWRQVQILFVSTERICLSERQHIADVQCTYIAANKHRKFTVTHLSGRQQMQACPHCNDQILISEDYVQDVPAGPDPWRIDALPPRLMLHECKSSGRHDSRLTAETDLFNHFLQNWESLQEPLLSFSEWQKGQISASQKCDRYWSGAQSQLLRQNACAVIFDQNCCKVGLILPQLLWRVGYIKQIRNMKKLKPAKQGGIHLKKLEREQTTEMKCITSHVWEIRSSQVKFEPN